jgi:GDP-L-fucose synthase
LKKSDKIIVTGAAGLVGSALVDHLRAEGYESVVPLRRADCDLLDTHSVFALFERLRPDHVFHAAARVYGIMGSMKHQGLSFYENCMINTNVVEASQRSGARKITVMGTGAVYPFPSPGPAPERRHDFSRPPLSR